MRRILALCLFSCSAAYAATWLNLPPEAISQINQAEPRGPFVKPRRERVVLVYSFAQGWVHDSIRYAIYALQEMGRRTGAFTTVISNSPAMFDPQRIAQFDAIILNNTSGDFLGENRQEGDNPGLRIQGNLKAAGRRASLINFVRSGHGLVGIHAANDPIDDWPEIGRVLGATYLEHPWNQWVTLRVLEPQHPLLAGLPTVWTLFTEIHEQGGPYSRSRVRELLALDPAESEDPDLPVTRRDGDFPVAWIRREGHGRVFFSSLGHEPAVFWNADVLEFYLRGIQYAVGDLEAPDSPSDPKAPPPDETTTTLPRAEYHPLVPTLATE